MEIFILAAGLILVIVALVRNRNRGAQPGTHYHGDTYYSHHDSGHGSGSRHGGDWGSRDMSHDHHHHGAHDSDASSGGGWGGDAADSGGGDGGGGDGGGGGGGE